jgi:hypothetical protein
MTLHPPRLRAAFLLLGQPILWAACSSGSDASVSPDAAQAALSAGDDASPTEAGDETQADAGAPDVFASCPATRPAAGSFPSDVAAVLTAKCQTCHQSPTKNHAPFPLLTYQDTQQADRLAPYTGLPIWQVMHTVIQPGGVPHMPFGSAPQLTSAEMQTLDGWLLACALPVAGDDSGIEASSDGATE